MNKYLKILAILTTIGLLAPYAFADGDPNAGTSASAFLKIPAGTPRAQALGNAYVSLAEGPDSIYWNPAGLSVATNKEIHVSYLQWIGDYKARTLAYVQPMGKTILAISGNYMDISGLDRRDDQGVGQPEGNNINVRNFVGTVSLARGFFDNFIQVGGTFKYINENLDTNTYNNIAFDVGGKLDFGKVGLGAAMINIGPSGEVPTGIRGGAHLKTKYYTLIAEAIKYNDYRLQYGAGLEIHIPDDLLQVARFDLRAGWYSRDQAGTNQDSWTSRVGLDKTTNVSFGFGMYSDEVFGYGTRIDFAMTPFGAFGTVYNLAAGVQF